MTLLNNILKNGTLFQEMRKSSVVPDGVIESRLYKESTVNTQIKMENTINKAYYYCECAMAKIDGTVANNSKLFKEAARRGASEGDILDLYHEGIKEVGNVIWTTIVNLYKAFIAAINSVRAFFVSQKGVLRKLDKVVEILKANAKKKPKVGAKVSVPLLIKTDAKDKNAIVANLIKSINALFVLSEGSVYASAELDTTSGKVIVTDFNKYITEVGSLDPLKEFAKGVKEFTTSQPTRESALKDLMKVQELLGNNDKNIRVVDSLIFAPMALIGGMIPSEEGLDSRKQRMDISQTKHFADYTKQIQGSLAKKPISTIILDSFTGEVSDKSLLPRLRANTVKFTADDGYLNIPELAKGLESAKEQIKRLFVGKKENLATLLGQIMKQSTKFLNQTKKGSAAVDKVAKKAGDLENVADKTGVDALLAGAKTLTAACNLLLKDYTKTVAECKIGINTLLNGTAKLVGKTISKEDGTGFEEDFDPEEDAKEGFKKEPINVNKPAYVSNKPGAKGSTVMPGLGAGKQRMNTGSKTPNFVDSKGRTKDIIAQVEDEHISAKELEKRKAAQRKGPRRR